MDTKHIITLENVRVFYIPVLFHIKLVYYTKGELQAIYLLRKTKEMYTP